MCQLHVGMSVGAADMQLGRLSNIVDAISDVKYTELAMLNTCIILLVVAHEGVP